MLPKPAPSELGFIERGRLKDDFLRHIRDHHDPLLFPAVIQKKLLPNLNLTLITPFKQSRKVRRTPCSSCAPDKPKFLDGALFRDNDTGELIVTGHVCAKKHIGAEEHDRLTADYASFASQISSRASVERHLTSALELYQTKSEVLKLAAHLHTARKELLRETPDLVKWLRTIHKEHGYFQEPYFDRSSGRWEHRIAGQVAGTNFLTDRDIEILINNLFIDVGNLRLIHTSLPNIDDMTEQQVSRSASLIASIRRQAINCRGRLLSAQSFFAQENFAQIAKATQLELANGLESIAVVSGRIELVSTVGCVAVINRPSFAAFVNSPLFTFE